MFAGSRPLEGHLQASWDHMAMARYLQAQAICMVTKVPRNHAVQSALVSQKTCIRRQSTACSLTGTLQLVTRAMLPRRAGGAEVRKYSTLSSFCSGLVSGIRRPDRL